MSAGDDLLQLGIEPVKSRKAADHPPRRSHPSRDVAAAIWKERLRQITTEGYSLEHDEVLDRGELALAAASYAIEAVRIAQVNPPHHLARLAHECWPFPQSANWPKPQRRLLVIAAAFLVAEIERLDRVSAS